MTVYARPGAEGSVMSFQRRYDNYIDGQWVAPTAGRYFENPTPVTGEAFCEVARSDESETSKKPWTPRTQPPPPGARRRPPSGPSSSTRSRTASRRTSSRSPSPNRGTTANRSAKH